MSTKVTDEPECESVADVQLAESSLKLETTVKPSDEFLEILNLSHTYRKEPGTFSKKQVKKMETMMEKLYDNVIKSENASLDDIVTLAYCYTNLCYVYISFNDKKHLSLAKYFISCSLNLLKDKDLHPKSILIALKVYHFLGYIFSKQQEIDKAIESYDKAVQLYFTYTQEDEECDTPIDMTDDSESHTHLNDCGKLELLYISVLEAAVSICNEKVPTNMNYVIAYKHLLLTVQLSKLQKTKQYYKWIKDALKIGYNLIKQNYFAEARNHTTTAFAVRKIFFLEKYIIEQEQLPSIDTSEAFTNMTALIIKFWIMYGVNFLRTSAARLLRLQGDTANNDLKSDYSIKSISHILQTLTSFDEMKGGNPFSNVFDHSMAVKSISGYDDAHKLFVHTLCQLKNFKFGYGLTEEVGRMSFLLDTSNVYKYMALYEKDTSQILLQNRHVELLSKAVEKETHTKYPFILKRLQLQLAIGYSILIDAKLESLEETNLVYMPQRYDIITSEIENLVEKALMNLKMYKHPVESQ